MRGFWAQTHWIVGITAGVVLALVGATGAILSFELTALDWLNRDVRAVAPRTTEPLSVPEIAGRFRAQHPGRRIDRITASAIPDAAWQVRHGDETIYVDPYSGETLNGGGDRGAAFFRATKQLHRWLVLGSFGDRDIGRQIVGACTALVVLLALSGLYLRWPRGRARNWRAWLTFNPALRGRTLLWHLHAVIGTCVLPLYLVMALTGLCWSYEWYRDGLYAIAGAERPVRPGEGSAQRGGNPNGELGLDELERTWIAFVAATAAHGWSTATVSLPTSAGAPVTIRYLAPSPPHDRAFSTFAADPRSGAVLRHDRYAFKNMGAKLVAGIEPLHTGSYFGAGGTIVFAIASLAMPVFAVTGWIMYLLRRRRAGGAVLGVTGA